MVSIKQLLKHQLLNLFDNQNFELTYNINAGKKFIFNDLKIILPDDYESKNFTDYIQYI